MPSNINLIDILRYPQYTMNRGINPLFPVELGYALFSKKGRQAVQEQKDASEAQRIAGMAQAGAQTAEAQDVQNYIKQNPGIVGERLKSFLLGNKRTEAETAGITGENAQRDWQFQQQRQADELYRQKYGVPLFADNAFLGRDAAKANIEQTQTQTRLAPLSLQAQIDQNQAANQLGWAGLGHQYDQLAQQGQQFNSTLDLQKQELDNRLMLGKGSLLADTANNQFVDEPGRQSIIDMLLGQLGFTPIFAQQRAQAEAAKQKALEAHNRIAGGKGQGGGGGGTLAGLASKVLGGQTSQAIGWPSGEQGSWGGPAFRLPQPPQPPPAPVPNINALDNTLPVNLPPPEGVRGPNRGPGIYPTSPLPAPMLDSESGPPVPWFQQQPEPQPQPQPQPPIVPQTAGKMLGGRSIYDMAWDWMTNKPVPEVEYAQKQLMQNANLAIEKQIQALPAELRAELYNWMAQHPDYTLPQLIEVYKQLAIKQYQSVMPPQVASTTAKQITSDVLKGAR